MSGSTLATRSRITNIVRTIIDWNRIFSHFDTLCVSLSLSLVGLCCCCCTASEGISTRTCPKLCFSHMKRRHKKMLFDTFFMLSVARWESLEWFMFNCPAHTHTKSLPTMQQWSRLHSRVKLMMSSGQLTSKAVIRMIGFSWYEITLASLSRERRELTGLLNGYWYWLGLKRVKELICCGKVHHMGQLLTCHDVLLLSTCWLAKKVRQVSKGEGNCWMTAKVSSHCRRHRWANFINLTISYLCESSSVFLLANSSKNSMREKNSRRFFQ
jgi:hypothetical protein